jgi:hypothetical protein
MANSVIRNSTNQRPFIGVDSTPTPREDSHIQPTVAGDNLGVTTKTIDQQSAARDEAVMDSHPAFSLWWDRWRREAETRVSVASIARPS